MAQQHLLKIEKLDAEGIAWPRQRNSNFGFYRTGMRCHHDDPIGEIDCFRNVVRHVYHSLARFPPDVREKSLHVVAGQRIEGCKRFVHQENGRIVGKGARDGDALLHPPGEMMRVRSGEFIEFHQAQLLARDFLPFILWHAFHLEAERDIAERGTPREKLRKILEYDATVHSMTVDLLATNADFAGRRRNKPRDDIE